MADAPDVVTALALTGGKDEKGKPKWGGVGECSTAPIAAAIANAIFAATRQAHPLAAVQECETDGTGEPLGAGLCALQYQAQAQHAQKRACRAVYPSPRAQIKGPRPG